MRLVNFFYSETICNNKSDKSLHYEWLIKQQLRYSIFVAKEAVF